MKPTAAPARFPYTQHRRMDQVMIDESAAIKREHYREQARAYRERVKDRAYQ